MPPPTKHFAFDPPGHPAAVRPAAQYPLHPPRHPSGTFIPYSFHPSTHGGGRGNNFGRGIFQPNFACPVTNRLADNYATQRNAWAAPGTRGPGTEPAEQIGRLQETARPPFAQNLPTGAGTSGIYLRPCRPLADVAVAPALATVDAQTRLAGANMAIPPNITRGGPVTAPIVIGPYPGRPAMLVWHPAAPGHGGPAWVALPRDHERRKFVPRPVGDSVEGMLRRGSPLERGVRRP
ncbi:hypothetical protein C7999DRAFT_32050 [Corynascus novoguineensis]|uniref:Uncharacterized protein n=1 Tax=Corynascus novoguineensis TaxID=1126955 RepID=A0AAN7HQC4_9PEZI|nr:hypothetical protein C7999DRAFT_32050 [Corynascus novoguineensis]